MRPKRLEIEGLQSFRDMQKIDFYALGETGLFGIFGPTGSGKSTVLDAITFALYGKVHRAERGTQGIINSNMNSVRVIFVFELLREGVRTEYRIERVYNRKKGNENSCEPKIVRLMQVTPEGDIPLCDKATEVSSRIEELLGLNHDDFTRAVVLPQNKFQEFLMLDNAKKREMLERIFYLEEYGRQLTDKVTRKIVSVRSRLDKVDGALSMVSDASDEALEAAGKEKKETMRLWMEVDQAAKEQEARFNEGKDIWMLLEELRLIEAAAGKLHGYDAGIQMLREELERANRAEGLQEMLARFRKLENKLLEAGAKLDRVTADLPEIQMQLEAGRIACSGNKANREMERPGLQELRTRLQDGLNLKKELAAIGKYLVDLQREKKGKTDETQKKEEANSQLQTEVIQLEKKLEEYRIACDGLSIDPEYRARVQAGERLESEISSLQNQQKDLAEKAVDMEEEMGNALLRLQNVQAALASALAELALTVQRKDAHTSNLPREMKLIQQDRDTLAHYQKILDILDMKSKDLNKMEAELREDNISVQNRKTQLQALEGEKAQAARILKDAQEELEKIEGELHLVSVWKLAEELETGHPCPVCGSCEHPHPAVSRGEEHTSDLEELRKAAMDSFQAADKAQREIDGKCLLMQEKLRQQQIQADKLTKDIAEKQQEYKQIWTGLPEELQLNDIDKLSFALKKKSSFLFSELQDRELWEKQLAELSCLEAEQKIIIAEHTNVSSGLEAGFSVHHKNRAVLEQEIQKITSQLNVKNNSYQVFLMETGLSSASDELARMVRADNKLALLQKQMEILRQQFSEKRGILEAGQRELQELKTVLVKLEMEIANQQGKKAEREDHLNVLTGGMDIDDKLNEVDKKLAFYIRQEKEDLDMIKELELKHNELDKQKVILERECSLQRESMENDGRVLKAAMIEKGFADINDVEQAMRSQEKLAGISSEIREYEKNKNTLQVKQEQLKEKIASRSITEQEWKDLQISYQQALERKNTVFAEKEIARNNYKNISEKHTQWQELSKLHHELSGKHGLYEQIQKMLKAERGSHNSFIDYIAEERLKYVAAKASDTLGHMTRNKYALELDADSGFIIRDNANGGVHRMVASLSGGETFLTALSLALALSEQIQLKGQSPLEFFFLDEGFGTLDNELLDTVIDSLERLSSKERVIGLISHVPELRARIPRRLVVTPPSMEGEGSRVSVEKG